MKLLGKRIEKDKSVREHRVDDAFIVLTQAAQGYVVLRPEEDEDMWHLYNIIQEVSFIYYDRKCTLIPG